VDVRVTILKEFHEKIYNSEVDFSCKLVSAPKLGRRLWILVVGRSQTSALKPLLHSDISSHSYHEDS
jgi:hypothetical protein